MYSLRCRVEAFPVSACVRHRGCQWPTSNAEIHARAHALPRHHLWSPGAAQHWSAGHPNQHLKPTGGVTGLHNCSFLSLLFIAARVFTLTVSIFPFPLPLILAMPNSASIGRSLSDDHSFCNSCSLGESAQPVWC